MQSTAQTTLAGQTVLVLGGSTGIGLATAKEAARQGASVIIVSGNEQKLNTALAQLPKGSKSYVVNLADEEAIKRFFETVGNIDHMVYTAGENIQLSLLESLDISSAKQFLNIRFWGALAAAKYAEPHLSKKGSIVLTGGSAGNKTGKGWLLGTAICRAMEGVAKTLALELAPVRVNIVAPGLVNTGLWDGMEAVEREALFGGSVAALPVGYVAGADDLALTYLHCMLQPYLTGAQIVVDGGYTLL